MRCQQFISVVNGWACWLLIVGLLCSCSTTARLGEMGFVINAKQGSILNYETVDQTTWFGSHTSSYRNWRAFTCVIKNNVAYISDPYFDIAGPISQLEYMSREITVVTYSSSSIYGLGKQKWMHPYPKNPEFVMALSWDDPVTLDWTVFKESDFSDGIKNYERPTGVDLIHESDEKEKLLYRLITSGMAKPLQPSSGKGVKLLRRAIEQKFDQEKERDAEADKEKSEKSHFHFPMSSGNRK